MINSYKLFKKLVENRFTTFTKNEKKIADFLIENFNEISFLKIDSFAKELETTPSSIVRFAKKINFNGFSDLQKTINRITQRRLKSIGPVEKAKEFKQSDKNKAIFKSLYNDLENIRKLINNIDEKQIKKFVRIILESKKKYIIANRSSYSLGHYLYNRMKIISNSIILLNNYDESIYSYAREITNQDVLIAISFPRYTKLTTNFTLYIKKIGTKILSITDNRASPLFELSDICIFCPHQGTTFNNKSHTAIIALLNTILSEIFCEENKIALKNLEKEEEILSYFGVLESEGLKSNKNRKNTI